MNDHDPENLRATDRKMRTSQATIAMPNGSHQQLGQHTRCNILPHAVAPLCAKPTVDTGACLIDGFFLLTFLSVRTNFHNAFEYRAESCALPAPAGRVTVPGSGSGIHEQLTDNRQPGLRTVLSHVVICSE